MLFFIRLRNTVADLFGFLAEDARLVLGDLARDLRRMPGVLLEGLDAGLTEFLWMLGIYRTSRAQKRAVADLIKHLPD